MTVILHVWSPPSTFQLSEDCHHRNFSRYISNWGILTENRGSCWKITHLFDTTQTLDLLNQVSNSQGSDITKIISLLIYGLL